MKLVSSLESPAAVGFSSHHQPGMPHRGLGRGCWGVTDLPRQHGPEVGAAWVRVCVCRGVPSPFSAEGSRSWWSCCPRGPVQSLQGGEASLTLEGLPGLLGWWESLFLQEGNERRPRACLTQLELGCRPLHSSDFVAGLCPVCERGPSWVLEGPAHPARQDLAAPSSAEGPCPSALWG